MAFHTRDAARDGKSPPTHLGQLQAVLNLVSIEAMRVDDDDEVMMPAKAADNNEQALANAKDVIARWQAHKQSPAPKRELIAVSSDEGVLFDRENSTTSAEEVEWKVFGRLLSQTEVDAELKSLAADVPAGTSPESPVPIIRSTPASLVVGPALAELFAESPVTIIKSAPASLVERLVPAEPSPVPIVKSAPASPAEGSPRAESFAESPVSIVKSAPASPVEGPVPAEPSPVPIVKSAPASPVESPVPAKQFAESPVPIIKSAPASHVESQVPAELLDATGFEHLAINISTDAVVLPSEAVGPVPAGLLGATGFEHLAVNISAAAVVLPSEVQTRHREIKAAAEAKKLSKKKSRCQL